MLRTIEDLINHYLQRQKLYRTCALEALALDSNKIDTLALSSTELTIDTLALIHESLETGLYSEDYLEQLIEVSIIHWDCHGRHLDCTHEQMVTELRNVGSHYVILYRAHKARLVMAHDIELKERIIHTAGLHGIQKGNIIPYISNVLNYLPAKEPSAFTDAELGAAVDKALGGMD